MPISVQRTCTKARNIFDKISSEEQLSKASIILLWAYLFNRISEADTDKDYETIISLSQKLSSTTGNLHTLYLKLKKEQKNSNFSDVLSEEDLAELESKLNLL